MALRCLTAGRMTQTATLLHQSDKISGVPHGDIDLDAYGEWVENQNPLTFEIVRVWRPYVVGYDPGLDNTPGTPDDVEIHDKIPCIARGIVDGGIRVAGTTERFGDSYENIDYVKLWVPGNVRITKRDRVTNITDRQGRVQWMDEEFYDPRHPETTLRATVFNVNGVTPLFDAFNNVREQFVLLERAEGTGYGTV